MKINKLFLVEHVCPWSGPAPTTFTHVATFFSLLTTEVVSLAAVFSIVTQCSSPEEKEEEERCVTILKTAARETTTEAAEAEANIHREPERCIS